MKTTCQTRWYERDISHSSVSKRDSAEFSIAHNPLQVVRTTPFGLTKWPLTICTTMHILTILFIFICVKNI
jgi:hypothetical protein